MQWILSHAHAHRRDGQPRDVIALDSGVLDKPILMTPAMRNMGDIPVHGETDRYADNHAPHNPRPAAQPEEQESQ